jgi:hypothetical protein
MLRQQSIDPMTESMGRSDVSVTCKGMDGGK